MKKTSYFRIGKTKSGEPFYNVQFGNSGGGCGLLKTLKSWDAVKYRALATHDVEDVSVYDAMILAFEHGGDWKRIADDALEKMIAEVA